MEIATYQPGNDETAVLRILREVGWIEGEQQEKAAKIYLNGSDALVAKINGQAECFAGTMPGTIKYLSADIPFTAVTGVVTSRISRKQGLASKLTARVIAHDTDKSGAMVAGLGIFEQGYYDRLGFGTGIYQNKISFDPAQLAIKRKYRTPQRLSPSDYKQIQHALISRRRRHGSINILQDNSVHAELHLIKKGFGLGYFDGLDGELTHFIWGSAEGEIGPYEIVIYAFQDNDQLLDLLTLIQSLGDQVRTVKIREPVGIQLQDLIRQPFRFRQLTTKNKFENTNRAAASYQLRICDLEGCLTRTHLPHGEIRFNLILHDPIEKYLEDYNGWKGLSGEYLITLGTESFIEKTLDRSLPTMNASVGAFTRLWMGVQPATGLTVTDRLTAPAELLDELDTLLRLPPPKPDWDF